jgi:hypothetical protein
VLNGYEHVSLLFDGCNYEYAQCSPFFFSILTGISGWQHRPHTSGEIAPPENPSNTPHASGGTGSTSQPVGAAGGNHLASR